MVLQFLLDLDAVRARDEEQMLEQVGHAGFAIAFVTGTDEVGGIDRDRAASGIRKEQDTQAVRK